MHVVPEYCCALATAFGFSNVDPCGNAAGSIAVGRDGSVRSKADVAHVAGALIRSALPMHYHITVNGGRI